ncbi:MAG: HEAT repeat domain-containing protein [Bryobacteraceae bacterium]
MTCEHVKESLSLFLYGELAFDEEDHVEDHLAACELCRQDLDRVREMHVLLQGLSTEPSPSVLRQSRELLWERLEQERQGTDVQVVSRWTAVRATLSAVWNWHIPRPVGALALLMIGFVGARVTFDRVAPTNASAVSQADPVASRVRYVEPDGNGRVQIVLDETRQRVVSGRLDDAPIRRMLLAAAKDSQDPGLRGETLGILNTHSQESEVREALMFAMQHDSNSGVRLRALAGLKPFAHEPEVQATLAQTVLIDTNPGVRAEAIDLLTRGLSKGTGQERLVGVLHQLMEKESNGYVRMRCQWALDELQTY